MEKLKYYPDVFIVGAPKAATTNIFNQLGFHPNIFTPKIKEPKFFSYLAGKTNFKGPLDKSVEGAIVKSFNDYSNLFKSKKKNQVSIDASVDFLYYYKEVIPLIKKYVGNPKIIICLRDPIARALSAYKMLCRDFREKETFENAIENENERIKQGYEYIWHYKSCSLYYEQVKAYIDNFTDVKIIIAEELSSNQNQVLSEVLKFLELPSFSFNSKKRYNQSGIPKNKVLHKLVVQPNIIKSCLKILPKTTKVWIYTNIYKKINRFKSMEYQIKNSNELHDFFYNDVNKLSNLLDKNIYNLWLKKYKY